MLSYRLLKRYFLMGVVTLLPLAVTLSTVVFAIDFLTHPFLGAVSSAFGKMGLSQLDIWFFNSQQLLRYGSQFVILIALAFFTLSLGFFTQWVFTNALLGIASQIIHRIPIVSAIYKTTQEIIKTLLVSNVDSFQQVVMVPFPGHQAYAVGLVAREAPPICSRGAQTNLVSVLVPTTPNPTTGFLVMYPQKDLIYLDIKPKEALKYIISCGVIIPGEDRELLSLAIEDGAW